MTYKKVEFSALTPLQKKICHKLFERGDLSFLMHPKQKELRQFFYDNPDKTIMVFNVSRQWGKSYLSFGLAVEYAIRYPKSQILYLAPTRTQAKDILSDKANTILAYAPPDMKIKKYRNEKYIFPNGSEIVILGIDNNPDRVRGLSPNLVILDEAAMCGKLEYAINGIIIPAFSASHGRLLLISTPPSTSGHYFKTCILNSIRQNAYQHATWRDSPFLNEERINRDIAPLYPGGIESARFRIEYEGDYNVQDNSLRVVPYFNRKENDAFFIDYERPELFQPYVGLDFGFTHSNGVVFGYLNFKRGCLVIEYEFKEKQLTSKDLAQAINQIEIDLWGNRPDHMTPLPKTLRHCDDNNLTGVADMSIVYGLPMVPFTKKQVLGINGMINQLNLAFQNKQVRIHPRCTELLFELENGLWANDKKLTYKKRDDGSHLDLLDALKYLALSVDYTKNPASSIAYDTSKVFIPNAGNNLHKNRKKVFGM